MRWLFILLICLILLIPSNNHFKQADQIPKKRVLQAYNKLPLSFIKNEGQVDKSVYYYVKQPNQAIYCTKDSLIFDLFKRAEEAGSEVLERLSFSYKPVGINQDVQVDGFEEQQGKANYFIGNDPSRWKTKIETYQGVMFKGIYDGVDLKVYGNAKDIETEYIVKPYADPSKIIIKYEGIKGLSVDKEGGLIIDTAFGELRESEPYAYQQDGSKKAEVKASYKIIAEDTCTFALASYDRQLPLVIDPTIVYSTCLKGGDARGIAVDSSGAVYVTGTTTSTNFPTISAIDATYNGSIDAFVTKINAEGSAIVYSTYLGGDSYDFGQDIAVDSAGAVYVTGYTFSSNFPIVAAIDSTHNDDTYDGFVTKINPEGSAIVYSTYLGGDIDDFCLGIAVDVSGAVYVTGYTWSNDFPTVSAADSTFNGGSIDAFVSKINATGSALIYSTYLGGSGWDKGVSIAVDTTGAAYVTGLTDSNDFPTTAAAIDNTHSSGRDSFVTKISAEGSALIYSTYLGGSKGNDCGYAIAVDTSGAAYVTGYTSSTDFPTAAAIDNTLNDFDAFVTKINAEGSALIYSTYLGGSGYDEGWAIAVDSTGAAYVTGIAGSTDFPMVSAFSGPLGTYGWDAFVTKINTEGSGIVYSTYLCGSSDDRGKAIAVDSKGAAYVTGYTNSSDFPIVSIINSVAGGAFVTKISTSVSSESSSSGGSSSGGSGSGGGGGGGAGCFVSTAAFGSSLAPQVIIMQQFRDQYLVTNPVGCAFLSLYHKKGPLFAGIIYQHNITRPIAKAILYPVVYICYLPMQLGYTVTIPILTLLLVLCYYRFRNVVQK